MLTRTQRWSGSLTIGDGWASLEGVTGGNAPHAHLAHQMTAAIDRSLEVECAGKVHLVPSGQYAIIPSGLAHSIGPSGTRIRSFYFDLARFEVATKVSTRSFEIADPHLSAALDVYDDTGVFPGEILSQSIPDRRRNLPGHALVELLESAAPAVTPRWVAQSLGVSSSRLRQISHSTFGVPISYVLQWRQLQCAARALSESASLADAADAGGFSDQAHFTRRMRRWFGVAPGAGLSGLDIRVSSSASGC